jgi:hypothetical protein
MKHSRLLSPLWNIQGCCLLYQTFQAIVSSIKHSRLLSPLSNFQGCTTTIPHKWWRWQQPINRNTLYMWVCDIKLEILQTNDKYFFQGCCLLYETFKAAVSSMKHSRLLSPLSNIQGCCLLYQTFKAAVFSTKHSRLLSPLWNIIFYRVL